MSITSQKAQSDTLYVHLYTPFKISSSNCNKKNSSIFPFRPWRLPGYWRQLVSFDCYASLGGWISTQSTVPPSYSCSWRHSRSLLIGLPAYSMQSPMSKDLAWKNLSAGWMTWETRFTIRICLMTQQVVLTYVQNISLLCILHSQHWLALALETSRPILMLKRSSPYSQCCLDVSDSKVIFKAEASTKVQKAGNYQISSLWYRKAVS